MENKKFNCLDNGCLCNKMHEVLRYLDKSVEKNRKLMISVYELGQEGLLTKEIKDRYINSIEGYKIAFLATMKISQEFKCMQIYLKDNPSYIEDTLSQLQERVDLIQPL